LKQQGPCALHRRTFAPVKAVDPDAAIEELVSGELFDFDLDPLGEEAADWASD
jgi:ribonuclease HII